MFKGRENRIWVGNLIAIFATSQQMINNMVKENGLEDDFFKKVTMTSSGNIFGLSIEKQLYVKPANISEWKFKSVDIKTANSVDMPINLMTPLGNN